MDALSVLGNIASTTGFALSDLSLLGKGVKVLFKGSEENQIKDDLVIIIDISRPCTNKVEEFLEREGIDAKPFVVSTNDGKSRLDLNDKRHWESIVNEFYKLLTSIHETYNPKNIHIFMSAPSSLAFAIGCTIGTVYRPYIYHFNSKTRRYEKVLTADDSLKY